MAWDYKNPTPPQRGDGRYEKKFPNSYQVLDCLRERHYDKFGSDLSFNGNNYSNYFGCCETHVYTYRNTAKSFAGERTKDKNPLLTIETEKGKAGEQNQYFSFKVKKEIFEGENKREAFEYLKECMYELARRNFNLILSDDEAIEFIHVPFERTFTGLGEFGCDYTTNEFARYLRMYYEHRYFYIEYVDPVIEAGLMPHEREWLEKCKKNNDQKEDEIEFGHQLSYINITKKNR